MDEEPVLIAFDVFVKSDIFQVRTGGFDWTMSVPAWNQHASGHADTINACYAAINTAVTAWAAKRDAEIGVEVRVEREHFDLPGGDFRN